MKAASISELQKELGLCERKRLLELCLRMAKYKKENKELLTYLIFEAHDEKAYIHSVKELIEEGFDIMNRDTVYLTKKSLRKVLRMVNKFVKYSGSKQTEIELRFYFCSKIRKAYIPIDRSTVLSNLFHREMEKITKLLSKMHEDIQYDYHQELNKLR